jgi:hypothetical protein
MSFVCRSNTTQLENQFGVQSDKELLNQVFTVKRCISLQKSKAEQKQIDRETPSFKPRKRAPGNELPTQAFKILAAPEVGNNLYANVLDWVQLKDETQKLALALQDMIYLLDPLVKNSPMLAIDFNKQSKNIS